VLSGEARQQKLNIHCLGRLIFPPKRSVLKWILYAGSKNDIWDIKLLGGPLVVKGIINKKKVKGNGFLELVGYPMGISNLKFYKKAIEATIRKSIWPNVKKKIKRIVKDLKLPFD